MEDTKIDDILLEALEDRAFAVKFKAAGDKYDLAVQIKLARTMSGMTVEELAEETGFTTEYIEQIEKAQANTTIEEFSKIAYALNKEISIIVI